MKILALLFTMLAVSAHPGHPAEARPNVLLICVDDLKPLLGCYGDKVVKTANIDRLAARGLVFERAFCNQAVCAPSRNALMTGLRPGTIGIYDLATNFRKAVPDAVTVTQHFMKNGYRAEAMGKIMHVGHGNGEDAASWSVPHWKPGGSQYQRPRERREARRGQRCTRGFHGKRGRCGRRLRRRENRGRGHHPAACGFGKSKAAVLYGRGLFEAASALRRT